MGENRGERRKEKGGGEMSEGKGERGKGGKGKGGKGRNRESSKNSCESDLVTRNWKPISVMVAFQQGTRIVTKTTVFLYLELSPPIS